MIRRSKSNRNAELDHLTDGPKAFVQSSLLAMIKGTANNIDEPHSFVVQGTEA